MFTLVQYFFDLINQLKSCKINKPPICSNSPITKKLKLDKINISHISLPPEPKVKYTVKKVQIVFRPCKITPKHLERMPTFPFIMRIVVLKVRITDH